MKYLLVLIVVAIAIGIWRSRRPSDPTSAARPMALPQDMLACARCGMHIPQTEALMTGKLAYCCADHQRRGPA